MATSCGSTQCEKAADVPEHLLTVPSIWQACAHVMNLVLSYVSGLQQHGQKQSQSLKNPLGVSTPRSHACMNEARPW